MLKLYASESNEEIALSKENARLFRKLRVKGIVGCKWSIDVASYCYIVWVVSGLDISYGGVVPEWMCSCIYRACDEFLRNNRVGDCILAKLYEQSFPSLAGVDDYVDKIDLAEFYDMMDFFGTCSEHGLCLLPV